jgi:hypothetical protein
LRFSKSRLRLTICTGNSPDVAFRVDQFRNASMTRLLVRPQRSDLIDAVKIVPFEREARAGDDCRAGQSPGVTQR